MNSKPIRSFYYGTNKEQIRQIISENDITNVADVYALLKDSFKDILQELMEAEMDTTAYSAPSGI